MTVRRGDVVLADIAYSDRTGSKKRPVVVVSTDANNSVIDDVIVAAISTGTRPGAFTHVFIDPGVPDGQSSGLLHPSYAHCENLFTLDQRFIRRTLGSLSPTLRQRVDQCLKAALGLP
jgi:mRNA interferase MazF